MTRPMMPRTLLLLVAAGAIVACKTQRGAQRPPEAQEPLVEVPDAAASAEPEEEEFSCDEKAPAAWPMFQRGPTRQSSKDAPPIEQPTLSWSRDVGITGWLNSPLIANDRVYVASSGQVHNKPDGGDGVFAFEQDGEEAWFHEMPGDANGIAYEKCRIFVTSDAGVVTALDSRSGEPVWTRELDGGKVYTNPLPQAGVVYVGNAEGNFYALDQATGETVWARALGGAIRGGAASDGERVFVGTQARLVVALDAETGESLWTHELADAAVTEIYPAPTVVGSRVVFGYARNTNTYYDDPAMLAFDAETGDVVWRGTNQRDLGGGWRNLRSSPALVGGVLIWGESYSNRIVTADAESGEIVRSTPAGRCMFEHWPSPASAGQVVYLPRHDGGVYAIDAGTGALNWSLYLGDHEKPPVPFPVELRKTDWNRCAWEPPVGAPIYASPAIDDDGTVFIATGEGWLHAIAASSSVAPAAEPEEGEQAEK